MRRCRLRRPALLAAAALAAAAPGAVSGLAPRRVGPCPAGWQEREALPLECAEFAEAREVEGGAVAAEGRSSEPGAAREACRRCLDGPLWELSEGEDLGPLVKPCASSPAVLYELLRHRARGVGRKGGRVAVCAKPGCKVEQVLACAEASDALAAVYWQPLAALVPWALAAERDGTSFAQPPGVPPATQFQCTGPPLHYYSMVEDLPPLPTPLQCGRRTFHPISFGIPKEDIVACLPRKSEGFASLIPGKIETYIFPMTSFGEMEYKRMYRDARYALSPRKGGWETMRIYEILAGGCVPFVPNITLLPKGSLPFLRRGLILRAMSLPGIDGDNARIDPSTFDVAAYEKLAARLLRHTQRRLSTEAIASYMLRAMGKPHARRVLFLANCFHGDYQCYLSLHGLRQVLGDGLVDVPRLPYMYRSRPEPMEEVPRKYPCPQALCAVVTGSYSKPVLRPFGAPVPVYGGGFSYGFRLPDVAVNRSEPVVVRQIRRREFDLVIVGNADLEGYTEERQSKRFKAMWKIVVQHYSPEEIAIIDGRDPPRDGGLHEDVEAKTEFAQYFLREIPDTC